MRFERYSVEERWDRKNVKAILSLRILIFQSYDGVMTELPERSEIPRRRTPLFCRNGTSSGSTVGLDITIGMHDGGEEIQRAVAQSNP